MKKQILILILAVTPVLGFGQKFSMLNYSVGFPSEDLKSFISEPSFRGVEFSYMSYIDSNISIGFSAAWNVFYERRANDTYTYNNTTINATQYRYTNSVPLFVSVNYNSDADEIVKYYAGLGVGTIYSGRAVDFGLYRYSVDVWHFGLAPQAGLIYEVNESTNIHIGARYNYAFKTSKLESQSFGSLNVGIAWRVW